MLLELAAEDNEQVWISLEADIIDDVKQNVPNYGQMACLQIVNEANTFEALLLGGVDSNNKSVRDIWRLTIKFESESFNSVNISYYCIKEEA